MAGLHADGETEGNLGRLSHAGLRRHAGVNLGDDVFLLGQAGGAEDVVGRGVYVCVSTCVTATAVTLGRLHEHLDGAIFFGLCNRGRAGDIAGGLDRSPFVGEASGDCRGADLERAVFRSCDGSQHDRRHEGRKGTDVGAHFLQF